MSAATERSLKLIPSVPLNGENSFEFFKWGGVGVCRDPVSSSVERNWQLFRI